MFTLMTNNSVSNVVFYCCIISKYLLWRFKTIETSMFIVKFCIHNDMFKNVD